MSQLPCWSEGKRWNRRLLADSIPGCSVGFAAFYFIADFVREFEQARKRTRRGLLARNQYRRSVEDSDRASLEFHHRTAQLLLRIKLPLNVFCAKTRCVYFDVVVVPLALHLNGALTNHRRNASIDRRSGALSYQIRRERVGCSAIGGSSWSPAGYGDHKSRRREKQMLTCGGAICTKFTFDASPAEFREPTGNRITAF